MGGDSGPATFNRLHRRSPTTDDAAMNDEPKPDYHALLAELREQAETMFPGWSAFMAERTDELLGEQDSTG